LSTVVDCDDFNCIKIGPKPVHNPIAANADLANIISFPLQFRTDPTGPREV
jgi:hypothetical protein